jgi:hypothetical protein
LAGEITTLGAAIENTQRIIIGNTDAIGQQMQGLEDWALGLINVRGTWGEIDALLNEGRISLDKYNEAQAAQETISAANATVQRDLLAIQAAQAPVVAENTAAYAAYIEQLRMMNDGINDSVTGAQDQLAALAWMDDATAGRVQQFVELGSSLQDLGPAGQASFQQMVDGLVATGDPMVALLTNVGLLRQETDGSFSVNFEGLDAANSDMENLTNSIDALTIALGGVPPVRLDVEGADVVGAALKAISDAPNEKNIAINITEGSTGIGGAAQGILSRLFGGAGAGDGTGGAEYTVSVGADTSPAVADIAAIGGNIPPVKVPVELDMSGLGGAAAGGAAGLAQAAMGQAWNSFDFKVGADTSEAEAAIAAVGTPAPEVTVTFLADTSAADTALTNIANATIADKTLIIYGDNTAAYEAINNVNNQVIDSKTLYILGDASGALNSINLVRNYDGVVLATSYVDIVARQIGSGAAIGNSIIAGTRGALGIHSPSTEFADIAKWSALGFQQGWEREFDNPSIGASVAPLGAPAYAGYGGISGGGGSQRGNGGPTTIAVHNHINVQGDVMSDDQLATRVVGPITDALVNVIHEERRGYGQ